MDYHARNRSQDDVIRIPADGTAFRDIEESWPHFKEEPCNLNIYLVVDGVNLFAQMKSIYTVWPIFVINNNIPPWLSIMREYIMLAMIIPGMCLQQLFFNIVASHLSYFVAEFHIFFSFTVVYYLYILMVVIVIYYIFYMFKSIR